MDPTPDYQVLYNAFRYVISVVHSSIHLKDVMDLVVWKSTEILGAKGAVMHLLNIDTDELEISASYGISEEKLIKGPKGPVYHHHIITDACRRKKVIAIEDIRNDPRVQYPEEAWEEGCRYILDVPLSVSDDVVGIIRLFFTETRYFSDVELDWLIAIAEQCSCALGKARLIDNFEFKYLQLASHTEKLSALGRMAAGIAHEINNPLAGILLYSTNMIKKVDEEDPLHEGLQTIIDETVRCRKIIQGLLEFSRGSAPRKEQTSVNDIIAKSLNVLENEFHLKRVKLSTELAADMVDVPADASQLEQVFVNLLINSIEAVPEGGTVHVATAVDPSGSSVNIEIRDNGPGISKADQEKIFEPFFSTKPQGTGLGLAVSYGIIRNHRGDISVQSRPGEGARFLIRIPVSQNQAVPPLTGNEKGK